ncbi:MAG: hypothetical protein HC767_10065 [Akkermansiaceae bacterium]|nr:hypothetical protein [Akkermansiaceae bacterium]
MQPSNRPDQRLEAADYTPAPPSARGLGQARQIGDVPLLRLHDRRVLQQRGR